MSHVDQNQDTRTPLPNNWLGYHQRDHSAPCPNQGCVLSDRHRGPCKTKEER